LATKINIKGRLLARPDVFSFTESGIKNPPANLPYGNVCIIDTGLGAGYGGGSGITGDLKSGLDSVYAFDNANDLKTFVKGGPVWDLATPLFNPRGGASGASQVFLVRASTTTQASLTLATTGSGNVSSVVIKTRDEGVIANGVAASSNLYKGYGARIIASPVTADTYIVQFFVGNYRGEDSLTGLPYEFGTTTASVPPTKLVQSPEITTLQEFVTWANGTSFEALLFKEIFVLGTTSFPGTSDLAVGDITSSGYLLFAGATESYDADDLNSVISILNDIDNTFFLSLESGSAAQGANNTALVEFLQSANAKNDKFVFIGGGLDATQFNTYSIATAEYFNSTKAVVVHGGLKKNAFGGTRTCSQLYKTAMVLGRVAGLPPYTPITYKPIDITGELHRLKEGEVEAAIESGVLYTLYDNELRSFVVGLGVNTLQTNDYQINEDGSSYSLQLERIKAQLNKEIVVEAKRYFFGKEEGANRNTVSEEDIKAWLEGFLSRRIAKDSSDNLLITYAKEDITVTRDQDNFKVTYSFVPNGEIKTIVFTGIMLDS